MAQPNALERIKEWIGGVAFRVFLWSISMTQDEYLDSVIEEARLEAQSEKNSAWFTL
jgi:hypothetical protein